MINEPLFTNLCLAASPWYSMHPRHHFTYGQAISHRELAAYLGGGQAVQLALVWAHVLLLPTTTAAASYVACAEILASTSIRDFDLSAEESAVIEIARGILHDVAAYKNTPDTAVVKDVLNSVARLPYERFVDQCRAEWADHFPKVAFSQLKDSRYWINFMQGRFYCFSTERAREEWDHQARENISRYAKVDA